MKYMQLTINNEFKSRILFCRHLDVIMTCCLFAVCRMARAPLQFKDIINSYKSQPQCLSQVSLPFYNSLIFDKIFTISGQEPVDIHAFYNSQYISNFRSLMNLANEEVFNICSNN